MSAHDTSRLNETKESVNTHTQKEKGNAKPIPQLHTRKVLAQQLDRRAHLLVADLLVLALLRVGLQSLPRQRAAVKVHEDETERLEVVAPALLCGERQ